MIIYVIYVLFFCQSQQKDLLQLMIDACDDDTKATLTTGEIVADAVTFLLAGYETTSNFLTYASYLLAINPDVQEKLSEEIISYLEENQVRRCLLHITTYHLLNRNVYICVFILACRIAQCTMQYKT